MTGLRRLLGLVGSFTLALAVGGAVAGVAAAKDVPSCAPSHQAAWTFDEGFHHFRIWYRTGVPEESFLTLRAKYLTQEMDTEIWPKLTELMHTKPVSKPLDICLVKFKELPADTGGVTQPQEVHCGQVPADIQLPEGFVGAKEKVDARDTLAHEFMHVLQFSLDVGCLGTSWWRESTATWAEDFVYPHDNSEQPVAHFYFSDMDSPLPGECTFCNLAGRERQYGSYVFPFFIARSLHPELIGEIWHKAEAESLLSAIDDVLPGGLKKQWPRFALDSWNDGAVDYFHSWDDLADGVHTETEKAHEQMTLRPGSDFAIDVGDLPHLSAAYSSYKVAPGVRTVAFLNGGPYAGGPSIQPDPDAKVQALVGLAGGSEEVLNWTGTIGKAYCFSLPSQHVTTLTLVFSNSNQQDDFSIPDKAHVIATNVGCSRWTGTIEAQDTRSDGVVLHTETAVSFLRQPASVDGSLNYWGVSGGTSWNVSGTSPDGCTYSGSGSWSVDKDSAALTLGWNLTAAFGNRGYTGLIGGPLWYSPVDYSCPDGSSDETIWVNPGAWTTDPTATVSPGGLQMQGNYTTVDGSGGTASWNWNLSSPG